MKQKLLKKFFFENKSFVSKNSVNGLTAKNYKGHLSRNDLSIVYP